MTKEELLAWAEEVLKPTAALAMRAKESSRQGNTAGSAK